MGPGEVEPSRGRYKKHVSREGVQYIRRSFLKKRKQKKGVAREGRAESWRPRTKKEYKRYRSTGENEHREEKEEAPLSVACKRATGRAGLHKRDKKWGVWIATILSQEEGKGNA